MHTRTIVMKCLQFLVVQEGFNRTFVLQEKSVRYFQKHYLALQVDCQPGRREGFMAVCMCLAFCTCLLIGGKERQVDQGVEA